MIRGIELDIIIVHGNAGLIHARSSQMRSLMVMGRSEDELWRDMDPVLRDLLDIQGDKVVTMTMEDLDVSFSGVVLCFEPGPDFQKGGQKPSMALALRRRLEGSETALLFVFFCGVALVIPGLVVPTFARVFIDEYLVSGRAGILKSLLIGMAATAAVRMVLTWMQESGCPEDREVRSALKGWVPEYREGANEALPQARSVSPSGANKEGN